jgi:hypothetical protein
MAGGDLTHFAAALENVRDAFRAAARERLALIREVARVDVAGAGTDAEAARRALVEALLRREAADADEAAPLEDRVRRSVAEARAAATARERLSAVDAVQDLSARIDRTWAVALNRADDLAAWLGGRADPPVSAAFTAYVQALRGLHDLGRDPTAAGVETAVRTFAAALQRLESAAGA